MQVHYFLLPAGDKPFDTLMIEARARILPGAFKLANPKELTYVVTASKAMAKYIAAKLQMDPRTSLATQGVITIEPRALIIYQDAPKEILKQMEDFVTWVMEKYPCRVLSEEGEDWTARYARNPKALFVEEDTWA